MKKALYYWIALGFLLLNFVSCTPVRTYTSGSYGNLKSYTSKLPFEGEKRQATFVSASAEFGRQTQEKDMFRDRKFIFSGDVHHSVSGRHYNYYFGIGAGLGSYTFKRGLEDVIESGERRSFYSVKAKAGINYTYSRPNVDFRFIGVELGYVNEFGPYRDKLDQLLEEAPGAIVFNPNSIISYNFYSEYAFKLNQGRVFTAGIFVGDLLSYQTNESYSGSAINFGATLGLQIKRFTFHTVFEKAEADVSSVKLGITYQL